MQKSHSYGAIPVGLGVGFSSPKKKHKVTELRDSSDHQTYKDDKGTTSSMEVASSEQDMSCVEDALRILV